VTPTPITTVRPLLGLVARSASQRTLQRAERTLAHTDAGAVSAATRKMIIEADRNELAVLIEELPSMVEAKGIGPEVAKQAKAKGPTKIGRRSKSTARQR
jgi:hypothetical protein